MDTTNQPSVKETSDASGVNRYRISKDTGINLAHISRIFSGQAMPSFKTACKIADAMGWSLDRLAAVIDARGRNRGDT